MIDLHCHFLPFLDDGAKNWEETLKMLEIAKEDGIEHIVATPHVYPEFFMPEVSKIKEIFEELKEKIKGKNLPCVYLGSDLHLTPETISFFKEGKAFTINGGRYVLVEPPEFFNEKEILEMLFKLRCDGYIPIITHPERYQIFWEKKELLHKIIEQGNLLQITSASINGYFGEDVENFSKELIKGNLIHIIASDGHSPRIRIPALKKAYKKIEKWRGSNYVLWIMENARKILLNEEIENFGIEVKRKSFLKKILEIFW